MKFESKFGIGEICGYNEDARRGDRKMDDVLVRVVSITFDINGDCTHLVEHIGSSFGVQRFPAAVYLLHGDPDFDQAAGCYPADKL